MSDDPQPSVKSELKGLGKLIAVIVGLMIVCGLGALVMVLTGRFPHPS